MSSSASSDAVGPLISPPFSYALSRLPQQHKYEDLVAGLSKKGKSSSCVQLLLFFVASWDDSLVAPAVRLLQDAGGKAAALQVHHLLRLAAPRVARNPQHATALEALENIMTAPRTASGEHSGAIAALWTLASMVRFADEPRRSFLAVKVVDWLAKAVESGRPEGSVRDPVDTMSVLAGLSACLTMGPVVLSQSQIKAPLWPLILKCFNCDDAVAVRHALKLLLERSKAEPGSCTSVIQGLLYSMSSVNLHDPLARVYFLQLCGLDLTPPAVAHVEAALEDVSFRVVLEAINVLTTCKPWDGLPHQKMLAPIVSAFQAPRPVLHYSALRACHMVGRGHMQARRKDQLTQLLPLVQVQVQNDSVFHRWRALIALTWLTNDPDALVSGHVHSEIRIGELTDELFTAFLTEFTQRAATTANPDWGMAILSCLSGALGHASKLLTNASLLVKCWYDALVVCGAPSAKVLASIMSFVQFPFSSTRFAFVMELQTQIAVYFGKNFALLRGAKGASQSMIVFLEGMALANNSKSAVEALTSVAAHEEKERIRGFFDTIAAPKSGFDKNFVKTVSDARQKI